ncbi:protein ORF22 [Southern Psittacara leucophthalmus aviadenovirus]|uniref:Protein ORF22 n=1 Tax=Southern Psittacara leucophthalmus aviadenovirus TaxID=2604330 RepID=A0AAE6IRS0_9ADEN|nr:protein ORF22 [Southern Psittacara leucophthalmus aviadenovirus]QEJ80784.1 protein ORF22 [Southern Psittacara leucophthalmus aviadenovirus]
MPPFTCITRCKTPQFKMADRLELDRLLEEVLDMEEEEQDVLQFHPLQMMCFENAFVESYPCACHNYNLIDPGVSITCNFKSDFSPYVVSSLKDNPAVSGVYFVSSWACTMYYDFNPVFIDLFDDDNEKVIRGVTINVRPENREIFLINVCKLCEAGVIPCEYMRRMDFVPDEGTVYLYPDFWFGELIHNLVGWQQSETIRLFDQM